MIKLFNKYQSIILYIVFGVLTTVINMLVYWLLYESSGVSNIMATAIAWAFAVFFAFITNKKWVFNSSSYDLKTLSHEVPSFLVARLGTGFLDIAIMYYFVDILFMNSMLMKLVSNILVIILNFIASKLFIFKGNGD